MGNAFYAPPGGIKEEELLTIDASEAHLLRRRFYTCPGLEKKRKTKKRREKPKTKKEKTNKSAEAGWYNKFSRPSSPERWGFGEIKFIREIEMGFTFIHNLPLFFSQVVSFFFYSFSAEG